MTMIIINTTVRTLCRLTRRITATGSFLLYIGAEILPGPQLSNITDFIVGIYDLHVHLYLYADTNEEWLLRKLISLIVTFESPSHNKTENSSKFVIC